MRAASFAMSIAKADVNSAMPLSTGTRPRATAFARLHHRDLLGLGERAVLAHGAADDEARHAVADQALHDARGGVDVEREVVAELRGDGGEDTFPGDLLRMSALLNHGSAHSVIAIRTSVLAPLNVPAEAQRANRQRGLPPHRIVDPQHAPHDRSHRFAHRRRTHARGHRRRPRSRRRPARGAPRAVPARVRPVPLAPSSTSRAARTCSSARCSCRRWTRPAPPASSSSTTSATSACAATARSASWRRSRTSGRIGAGEHRIETPGRRRHRHAASRRRGLGRQRAELAREARR